MVEPNCDMPWEIYLDWLQDQGNEDLRFIDMFSLVNTPDWASKDLYGNAVWFVYPSGDGWSKGLWDSDNPTHQSGSDYNWGSIGLGCL